MAQAYRITSEKTVYKRYIEVRDRQVQFTDNQRVSYDLVGHSYPFVVVCVYFSTTQRFKLIYEYCQGSNSFLYNFACGGFEPHKHRVMLDTVKAEVNEECAVKGGTFINLIEQLGGDELGLNELKWSFNRFFPYLNLNPSLDLNPKPRDLEEKDMRVVDKSGLELEECICRGELMLPAVQTYFMAKNYLQQHNLL